MGTQSVASRAGAGYQEVGTDFELSISKRLNLSEGKKGFTTKQG